MSARFDHVVVFVPSLEKAINDFTDLGFNVTRGGAHGSTENALIIFSNQSYIELLALRRVWFAPFVRVASRLGILEHLAERKGNIFCRLLLWVNGEFGPVDWCVRVNDLAAKLSYWKDEGLQVLKSESFSRTRLDGQVPRWYLGGTRNIDLPVLIEDITPFDDRVPLTGVAAHPNGAEKLVQMTLRVSDKLSADKMLRKFLLPKVCDSNVGDEDISIGDVKVRLADHSMTRKFALTLLSTELQVQQLDTTECHGLTIDLV
jgi:hypothetical protein